MEQQSSQLQNFLYKEIGSGDNNTPQEIDPRFKPLPYKIARPNNNTDTPTPPATPEAEQVTPKILTQEDVENSHKSGYEAGYAKGYDTAKSEEIEIAKQVKHSLDDISIKLAAISEAIKTRNNDNIHDLVKLSLRIAYKVAGSAIKKEPYAEIEDAIRRSLPLLFDEPSINISVNNQLAETIESNIRELAKSEGLKNNIEISPDPILSPGSCDISWNGGGIKSDKDDLWKKIDALCENL